MLFDVSIFRWHPIVNPMRMGGSTIPGKSSAQSQLTWTIHPHTKVKQVSEFRSRGIHTFYEHDALRLDFVVLGESI